MPRSVTWQGAEGDDWDVEIDAAPVYSNHCIGAVPQYAVSHVDCAGVEVLNASAIIVRRSPIFESHPRQVHRPRSGNVEDAESAVAVNRQFVSAGAIDVDAVGYIRQRRRQIDHRACGEVEDDSIGAWMRVCRLDGVAQGAARVAILARAENDRITGGVDQV